MNLISDEVLDAFERGWTPEQVRGLVKGYRELKRVYGEALHVVRVLENEIEDGDLDQQEPAFAEGQSTATSRIAAVLDP